MPKFHVELRCQGEGIRHADFVLDLQARDHEAAYEKALALWQKNPDRFTEVVKVCTSEDWGAEDYEALING